MPSGSPWEAVDLGGDQSEFHAVIVAGDPNGSPGDSPSNRVDPNTTTSPFAGVGSVRVNARRGVYIGTGTPLDSTHILTAGHVVDLNSDGKANSKDGIKSVYFNLNYGGNLTHSILVTAITLNPDFTGFNHPSINDDLAILTLSSPLPAGVPTYGLPTSDLAAGTTITLVGYGQSGDGVNGYTINASFSVKRVGQNNADAFYGQDDAGQPAANEVFRFDFDGPSGNGTFGGPTVGNNLETTLGGGDSGGPSFVGNVVVGVNTFTQGFNAPRFGSLGGGINVFPYVDWIHSVMTPAVSPVSEVAPGNNGNGNGTGTSANQMREFFEAAAASDNFLAQIDAAEAFRANSVRTTVVFLNVSPASVRPAATVTSPAAAASTPSYLGHQTTAQLAEAPANAEEGANSENPMQRNDSSNMPPIQNPPDSSHPPQAQRNESISIDATILALVTVEHEVNQPRSMRYETGAAADGADQSLADMVIPQSTAALAGLLMLAGGRQGLSPDEALRAGSQRRRSRRNTTE